MRVVDGTMGKREYHFIKTGFLRYNDESNRGVLREIFRGERNMGYINDYAYVREKKVRRTMDQTSKGQ